MKQAIVSVCVLWTCTLFIGCAQEKAQTANPVPAPDATPAPAPVQHQRPALEPLGGSNSTTVTMTLPAGDQGGTVYLEKSAPKEVLVGREFDYKIRITNTTRSTLDGVTITGKLPEDFKVVSTTPQANIVGKNATWSLGKIAPGESKLFVVRGMATRSGALYGCSDLTFTIPSACLTIKAVEPALKISQTAPEAVLVCDAVPIKIVVTNSGTGSAENVIVKETLPEGLTTSDGKTEVSYDLKTIDAGQTRELTVDAKPAKTGAFVAKATLSANDGLSAAAESRTTVRQPVLTLTHDAPATRYLSLPVTHTLSVTNTGDGTARNCRLSAVLPTHCEMVSASEDVKPSGGQLVWNLGDLAPQASKKVTFTVKPSAIGSVESLSSVTAVCAKASAKAVTDVRGVAGILLTCVDETDPILVGSNETYVITVTNQGTAKDTNIVIKCILPDEQQFVSASGPTKETVDGQIVTFAPNKSLEPKAALTYKVVVKAIKAGDVRFKAQLLSDQIQNIPAEKIESTNQYSD